VKAFQEEVQGIYLADNRPWVIGYSGGKDSTATLQLVWYALAGLPPEQRKKTVYVIASDTFVETPVIVGYIDENLEAINRAAKEQGVPFEAHKVTPEITDTFWVNLIGRGYPPPSTRFRWCTDRMKIQPANKFILDRVAEFGEVIMVLGSRQGESASRDQVLKAHAIQGSRLRRHSTLANAFVLAPIEEFTTEDVWTYILQVKCPWGTNNSRLVTMYRNAGAGECPLVVDTSTPSCGNSRFGCWVCTVVEQDHSMESLVDSGEEWMEALLDFRNLLKSHHDPEVKRRVRRLKRRDGKIRLKKDGTPSPGPYELEERKKLLRTLLEVQTQVRREGPDPDNRLISAEELHEIRRIWRTEESDWEDSVPLIYRQVFGEDLDWVQDDVTALTAKDQGILKDVCKKHGTPADLVAKLIDVERQTHGMSRRAGIYDRIDALFRQDWPDEEAREAFRSGLDKSEEEDD
jgi:DNA sulfur modification protein DndC